MDEFGGHWVTTFTGKKFHFLDPQPEEIDIVDIAHSLSITCRFGGQCREFYSVAEHSIRMAEIVPKEYKLLALLHDASEAYLPDLPRPMKAEVPKFREMEASILVAIWRKFNIDSALTLYSGQLHEGLGVIKEADNILLATEARDLMANMDDWAPLPKPLEERIAPMKSKAVESLFLFAFKEYGGKD